MGKKEALGFNYNADEWREHGIKASRFKPCPHCGGAVAARERAYSPRHLSTPKVVFRSAYCVNDSCGWRYFRQGGSREAFVDEVNTRKGMNE